MLTDIDKKVPKSSNLFLCKICDYTTSRLSQYNRHLSTDKHKMLTDIDINIDKKVQKSSKPYLCECGKEYKHRQSLSLHKKKCQYDDQEVIEKKDVNELDFKQMFLEMVNQNKELQKTIIDQNKMLQSTITEIIPKVGNTTNSNNNTNNIVMNNVTFLNSNCKNAITLTDFIDSIPVEVEQLEYTGKKGLAEGVSNLFIENYNKLPLQLRPLWCGDKKRKKLYIKEDEWIEDKDNQKTKEAIKNLTVKQAKNTNKFAKKHPDWMGNDKKKEAYLGIIGQTTSDVNDKIEKIMNNIADKTHLTNDTKDGLITIE